jgi:hypothetical protein
MRDLALRFIPRHSDQTSRASEGGVPADPNLGQHAHSAKPLCQLDNQPVRRSWDSWDTPSRVPLGRPQANPDNCAQAVSEWSEPSTGCSPARARTLYQPNDAYARRGLGQFARKYRTIGIGRWCR